VVIGDLSQGTLNKEGLLYMTLFLNTVKMAEWRSLWWHFIDILHDTICNWKVVWDHEIISLNEEVHHEELMQQILFQNFKISKNGVYLMTFYMWPPVSARWFYIINYYLYWVRVQWRSDVHEIIFDHSQDGLMAAFFMTFLISTFCMIPFVTGRWFEIMNFYCVVR
jgi:hypothetical protein